MKQSTILTMVLVLLVLTGFGYKYYEYKTNPNLKELLSSNDSSEKKAVKEEFVNSKKTVNIDTERPVNGVYKGVIEVGASGFNSFVINIDKDKNWEIVSKEFGESLSYEGFATTDDVKLGLKKYLSKMFEKGVSGRNAHFVISSGALKNPKTELIAKAIEQMGYVVNRVTAEQEGKFALKALLPKSYKDKGFVVDIGSGNTKISWYENGKLITEECSGAKYYQIPLKDEYVYKEIKTVVDKIPDNLKHNAFFIGGVPFSLAKESNVDSRYVALEAPENYSYGDDIKKKSGLNIYNAIYTSAKSDNYIFDYDANFTIGFLMSLN